MADIFGGAQLPAWLQERAARDSARENGQWGHLGGTLLGGLVNSLKRDENAPVNPETGEKPRQGFLSGLQEARLNQQDPLWRLKSETAQVHALGSMAQAQSAFALANERKQELRAWMEDVPIVTPWLVANPEARQNLPVPQVKSTKAMQAIEARTIADDRYFNQKEQNRIRDESSKAILAKNAIATEYENTKLKFVNDPVISSGLDALRKNGREYQINPDGTPSHFPSPEAMQLINQKLIDGGDLPIGANEAQRKDKLARDLQKQKEASALAQQTQKDTAAMDRLKVKLDAEEKKLKGQTTPQFVNLGGNDWGVYLPDRGGIQILRDPARKQELMIATKEFDDLLKRRQKLEEYRRPQKEKDAINQEIEAAKKKLSDLTISKPPPAAVNSATPNPSRFKIIEEK